CFSAGSHDFLALFKAEPGPGAETRGDGHWIQPSNCSASFNWVHRPLLGHRVGLFLLVCRNSRIVCGARYGIVSRPNPRRPANMDGRPAVARMKPSSCSGRFARAFHVRGANSLFFFEERQIVTIPKITPTQC